MCKYWATVMREIGSGKEFDQAGANPWLVSM